MAFAPRRSPRPAARIALLTFVTVVALTACSDTDGTLTEVKAIGTPTGTTAPALTASSPSPSASASSPTPGTKNTNNSKDTKKKTGTDPGKTGSSPAKTVASDVSQLTSLGITLNDGVLIDVADDGLDRYLEVGADGVDFTGTSKKDTTMMALKPAQVAKRTEDTKNRVVIAPPFWNEDLGTGSCVVDQKNGVLDLATCKAGAADQIWEVVPAGDSGQFELHGAHTDIRVEAGKITTGDQGYVGLQTIAFAS